MDQSPDIREIYKEGNIEVWKYYGYGLRILGSYNQCWFVLENGKLSYYSSNNRKTKLCSINLHMSCFHRSGDNLNQATIFQTGLDPIYLRFPTFNEANGWLRGFKTYGSKFIYTKSELNNHISFGYLVPNVSFPNCEDAELSLQGQLRQIQAVRACVTAITAAAGAFMSPLPTLVLNGIGGIQFLFGNKESDVQELILNEKIDGRILQQAICDMNSYIETAKSRYLKMVAQDLNITIENRVHRAELVLFTCEILLNHFCEVEHTLRRHTFITAPYLVRFATLYICSAIFAVGMKPELFRDTLKDQMSKLVNCLNYFKEEVVRERLSRIKYKYSYFPHECMVVADDFYSVNGKHSRVLGRDSTGRTEELYKTYTGKIKSLYQSFFDRVSRKAKFLNDGGDLTE